MTSVTGVTLTIPVQSIEPLREPLPAEELASVVYARWARTCARNRAQRKPYDPLFDEGYLDAQASAGLADGRWGVRDGALRMFFDDEGGAKRVYAIAGAHLIGLAIGVMLLEDNFERSMRFSGWRYAPSVAAMDLMDNSDAPLIELRGALCALVAGAAADGAPRILAPPGVEPLPLDRLDPRERSAVERAWSSRACQCQLCEYYRPRVPKMLARRAASDERAAKKAQAAAAKKGAVKKGAAKKGTRS